jgi:hypothetical protein
VRLFISAALVLPVIACSSKKNDENGDKKVVVNAGSLAISQPTMRAVSARLLGGPETPDYAAGEYDGMGVNTSDAVVEGFKITLTSVSFGNNEMTAASFPIENGELDISQGVNSSISVTGTLPGGKWDRVNVAFKPGYKLTAYAYMDSDNNGTIDKTVFTTPGAVKAVDGRLSKTELTAQGYGEYTYGFAYVHCSDSVTNSTQGQCGTISVFPTPFSVDDPIQTEEGEETPETHVVNVLIDSSKVVTAWLGTSGSFLVKGDLSSSEFLGDTSKIPMPIGFPASDVCSDTKNEWDLNSCNFFPIGTPAFKLAYLPAFAFLSTSGLSSQIYLVSTEDGLWNHYNSGTLQFVFKDDVPQMGLAFTSVNAEYDYNVQPPKVVRSATPVFGSVSRLFEETGSSTYTFYMDGGSKNAAGVDDGGLYYNNDKTMAGYIVEGFKPTEVDGTGTIVVKDGPRCKSDYDNCLGARTYYVKRIK